MEVLAYANSPQAHRCHICNNIKHGNGLCQVKHIHTHTHTPTHQPPYRKSEFEPQSPPEKIARKNFKPNIT